MGRRRMLRQTGSLLLLTATGLWIEAGAGEVTDIDLAGMPNGAEVWFRPRGLLIPLGHTVRWINRDQGNVHTSTAYHPDNGGKPLRIPAGAKPWNSGYLLPGKAFTHTFDVPGVYDYFCIPHEHAGMVARIIVQAPEANASTLLQASDASLPQAAREAFIDIPRIMKEKRVD
jgi:plastocyanin